MQTPFSPVSFGKSIMKIRSSVPENGCLIFFCGRKKTKKKQKKQKKTYVKHIRYRLIGGCVNKDNIIGSESGTARILDLEENVHNNVIYILF